MASIDSLPISDCTLEGSMTGRVRDLAGFVKRFHREPDTFSAATERFIATAGSEDVARQAEDIYEGLRQSYHYKRREIILSQAGATASIMTPDFQVQLRLGQDPSAVERYQMVTEVTAFRDGDVVRDERFSTFFDGRCDTLIVSPKSLVKLDERVDELEENEAIRPHLTYDSQCTWFELRLPGTGVIFHATADRLCLSLEAGGSLADLLSAAEKVFACLAGAEVDLGPLGVEG